MFSQLFVSKLCNYSKIALSRQLANFHLKVRKFISKNSQTRYYYSFVQIRVQKNTQGGNGNCMTMN